MLRTVPLIAFVVLALVAGPAMAVRAATTRVLADAERQADAGDFEAALGTLQAGLASPDNTDDDFATLYWRLGEVYVFLRRDQPAAEAFDRLLYLDARYEPPKLTSPGVRKAFERARRDFETSGRELAFEIPPQSPPRDGRPFDFEARIAGLRDGLNARLFYRRALDEAWAAVDFVPVSPGSPKHVAHLPPIAPGTVLEYYAEILDSTRQRLRGQGSALAPRTLKAPKDGASPGSSLPGTPPPVAAGAAATDGWYRLPWVWGVVGGALALTGTGVYFATRTVPTRLVIEVKP